MMVVVPAIVSLLPGLTIYTGLLQLVTDDAFDGIVSLVRRARAAWRSPPPCSWPS